MLASHPAWKLVANLPYNVATPLILDLLRDVPAITEMLVMVQLEVAERLAATAPDPAIGIPSVLVAYHGRAEVVGRVPPTVFHPKPRVDSALVRIVRHEHPPVDTSLDRLEPLVRAAYNQRRKMIRKSLSGLRTVEQIEAAGVDPQARPRRSTLPRGAGWPTPDSGTGCRPAFSHQGEQFGHRCRLAPTLELPVTGVEERHDAFRLAPVGPPVERDIGCCGGEIHLGVETASCLGVAVLVVRPDLPHAGEIGDRPVPRHDRVRLPRLDAVEGPEKVGDRARPQDWMPSTKRMSPVNTVARSATWISTSPPVCAGPTSTRSTTVSPTVRFVVPLNVDVGSGRCTPPKSKRPKQCWKNSPTTPIVGAASNSPTIIAGFSRVISSAAITDVRISAPSSSSLPLQWSPLLWVLTSVVIETPGSAASKPSSIVCVSGTS